MHKALTETVAVLGATDNPGRFAHKCMRSLAQHGHRVLPVNPGHDQIDGMPCYPDLGSCPAAVDTVTVYVRPSILNGMLDDIVNVRPTRGILNPGTEDAAVISQVQIACTLVLLNTNQYNN